MCHQYFRFVTLSFISLAQGSFCPSNLVILPRTRTRVPCLGITEHGFLVPCPKFQLHGLEQYDRSIPAGAVDTFHLLPDTQMGAHQGQSTESARELLMEQVHAVRGESSNKVAMLMSMGVAGALNAVSYYRLFQIYEEKL